MIPISKYRYYIIFFLIGLSALFFFLSSRYLELDNALHKVLPLTEDTRKKFFLSSYSSFARKIILYIEVTEGESDEITGHAREILAILEKSDIEFTGTTPTDSDIRDLLFYIQKNSALLYNYDLFPNPFTKSELKKRITAKSDFILSAPLYLTDEVITNDPLFMAKDIFKTLPDLKETEYTIKDGLIFSKNKRSILVPYTINIKPDDYKRTPELITLNKKIADYAGQHNCNAFLFSSHFFYLESYGKIKKEITILSILSLLLTLFIFFFFFKDIKLTLFAFTPIVFSLSTAFLAIALFRKSFSSISLAFCATTVGISIDYTVHYLVKRRAYKNLGELRRRNGPSLVLGFITTLATFFFLPFSNIGSLQEIALFGSIVICVSFLVSWFIIQPLLMDTKSRPLEIHFPRIKVKKGLLLWLLLIVPVLVPIPFLQFETNITNLDFKHKELKTKMELIGSSFSESIDSLLLVFYGETEDKTLAESLRGFNAVYKENEKAHFFTPAVVYPPASVLEKRRDFISGNFNTADFKDVIAASIFTDEAFKDFTSAAEGPGFFLENVPEYIKKYESMIVPWKKEFYLVIPITGRKQLGLIDTVLKDTNINYFIIDTASESSKILYLFEKKTFFLLLLSLIVIFLILLGVLKNVLYAFGAILPSVAALAACLGFSVILRKPFNIMHLTSSILILGIGVDYGIFITMALVKKMSKKEYNLTLQSILISALTTLAGFGVLMFSSHNALSSLGSSMFIGILCAFATAYLAVPAVIRITPPSGEK